MKSEYKIPVSWHEAETAWKEACDQLVLAWDNNASEKELETLRQRVADADDRFEEEKDKVRALYGVNGTAYA